MKPISAGDPRFKYALLKQLEQFIYGPVKKKLEVKLDDITTRNGALTFSNKPIFYYKGKKWTVWFFSKPVQGIPSLHPELHAEMDEYIELMEHINNVESPLVLGFLRNILNHSNNVADFMALIPTTLHAPLQDVLTQLEGEVPTLTTVEVAAIIGASEASLEALQLRMMSNLLEA